MNKHKLTIVDLYCGAGGIDHSLVEYCDKNGYELDLTCINHWDKAIATNRLNHPNAKHLCMSVEQVNPREVVPGGQLDLLILAPQCIFFTKARGGKPVTDQMRANTAPVQDKIIKFPLTPSAFWDNAPTLEWSDVSPRSLFGRAAIALGLRLTLLPNGTLRVLTTQEELALLIVWAWEKRK